MKISDLNEARRNANHPTQQTDRIPGKGKIEYTEILRKYLDKGYFVTFTEINKVGINPSMPPGETPVGIYTFPLKKFLPRYFKDFMNRPYMTIIKPKVPLLDVNNYTLSQLDKDFNKLKELYPTIPSYSGISWDDLSFIQNFLNSNKDDGDADPMELIDLYNDMIDDGIVYELFSITYRLTNYLSNNNELLWNKILRQLGYYGLVDMGAGIIHEAEETQAVFFKREYFEVIKTYQKSYDTDDSEFVTQHNKQRTVDNTSNQFMKYINSLSYKGQIYEMYKILTGQPEHTLHHPKILEFLKRKPNKFIADLLKYVYEDIDLLQVKLRYIIKLLNNVNPMAIRQVSKRNDLPQQVINIFKEFKIGDRNAP